MNEKLPFFLCATSRVGYHLLASLLNSTNSIEPIIAQAITGSDEEDLRIESDEEWLKYWGGISKRHRIDTTKIWGSKFYNAEEAKHYLSVKGASPSSIKWIWMRRRDKIRQAISMIRAIKSGIWFFGQEGEDYPTFEISPEIVNVQALEMYNNDDRWEDFFRENELKPHILFYEDFEHESSWKPTVLSVLEFLEDFPREDINVSADELRMRSNEKIYEAVMAANNNDLIELRKSTVFL